jgi:hypothetical protein
LVQALSRHLKTCWKRRDTICSNHRGHGHFIAFTGDLDGLMAEMIPFFDMRPTEAQLAAIRSTAAEQRAYSSKHTYKLAKYGLDADRIRRDCAFVYDEWLTPRPAESA